MTRICLITPNGAPLAQTSVEIAAARAAELCADLDVAAIRIAAAGATEAALRATAAALEPVRRAHDVALVLETHYELAHALGLDGAHVDAASGRQKAAAELLGADAIVGVFCGASKHAGLVAGERGASYVSFGPVAASGNLLDDGDVAEHDIFAWWQELIETPVCAEGGVTAEIARSLAGSADFVFLEPASWLESDDVRAVAAALTTEV